MIFPNFQCVVSGDAFSPSRVAACSDFAISNAVDASGTGKGGRATISVDPTASLERLVDCLEKHAVSFRLLGGTDIEIFADIRYESQANWELAPEMLARIGRLNAHLLMSFYE